jgi:hypothetical protein
VAFNFEGKVAETLQIHARTLINYKLAKDASVSAESTRYILISDSRPDIYRPLSSLFREYNCLLYRLSLLLHRFFVIFLITSYCISGKILSAVKTALISASFLEKHYLHDVQKISLKNNPKSVLFFTKPSKNSLNLT